MFVSFLSWFLAYGDVMLFQLFYGIRLVDSYITNRYLVEIIFIQSNLRDTECVNFS